jgi:hypothetical protein
MVFDSPKQRWLAGALILMSGCASTAHPIPDPPTIDIVAAEEPIDDRRPDFDFDEEGAMGLALGLKEVSAQPERLGQWLHHNTAMPFGIDGAHKADDLPALEQLLKKEYGDLGAALGPHDQCQVLDREKILAGAPFHFVDRLGHRPPAQELSRDLDRVGLSNVDMLVNCFRDGAAGFFLIITNSKGKAVIKALRM